MTEMTAAELTAETLLGDAKYPIYNPSSKYQWAMEAYQKQHELHWLPSDSDPSTDMLDWAVNLTEGEKNFLTKILLFFTQADVEVGGYYINHYMNMFSPLPIKFMLTAFAHTETIHVTAYASLLTALGMPTRTFREFLAWDALRAKADLWHSFDVSSPHETLKTLYYFAGFAEGISLFSAFAILLNFQRFNKMKHMGKIVAWSSRDENLHVASMLRLAKEFAREHADVIDTDRLKKELVALCHQTIDLEDRFIDLAFASGDIEGLTAGEMKQYIRWVADNRLTQMELPPAFASGPENPLPWVDININEFANFFESTVSDYGSVSLDGIDDSAYQ